MKADTRTPILWIRSPRTWITAAWTFMFFCLLRSVLRSKWPWWLWWWRPIPLQAPCNTRPILVHNKNITSITLVQYDFQLKIRNWVAHLWIFIWIQWRTIIRVPKCHTNGTLTHTCHRTIILIQVSTQSHGSSCKVNKRITFYTACAWKSLTLAWLSLQEVWVWFQQSSHFC